jgi:hypothetical protein
MYRWAWADSPASSAGQKHLTFTALRVTLDEVVEEISEDDCDREVGEERNCR